MTSDIFWTGSVIRFPKNPTRVQFLKMQVKVYKSGLK